MTMWKSSLKSMGLMIATAIVAGGTSLVAMAPVQAQDILREEGTLRPIQDEYTFTGEANQSITITMNSDEFDTVLVLLDENGQEVAMNDDYARTLNSTIVMTLPDAGNYRVLARSFSGEGGDYTLVIRPSTPYEQAYSEAQTLYYQGNFTDAIAAYDKAIQLDPDQPTAYLDRADTRWSAVYAEQGYAETPTPPPADVMAAIIADYEQAAALYEQAGDSDMAQAIREQITYLENPQLPQ